HHHYPPSFPTRRSSDLDLQIRLPHVGADKTQLFHHLRPQRLQPSSQRHLRTTFADPQQAPAVRVDLVDDRQEIVGAQTMAPMNRSEEHTSELQSRFDLV